MFAFISLQKHNSTDLEKWSLIFRRKEILVKVLLDKSSIYWGGL